MGDSSELAEYFENDLTKVVGHFDPCTHCISGNYTGLLLVCTTVVESYCGSRITSAAFNCFRFLQVSGSHGDSGGLLVAGGDVELVWRKCRDGSFERSMHCLEKLFMKCGDNGQSELHHYINLASVRWSFSLLCQDREFYAAHSLCLRQRNSRIQRCVTKTKMRFQEQISTSSFSNKLQTMCKFIQNTTRCVESPVRNECSVEFADFIVQFMTGLAPPSCQNYPAFNHGNSIIPSLTPFNNHGLFLLISCFVIIFPWVR